MNIKVLVIAFFCSLVSLVTKAQGLDSLLRKSSDNFQQEKIHIHFDRSVYNKGETIWFKAYIMAGIDLTDYSKSVYFDWYDDNGNLLKHIASAIFESTARGQFTIPDKYKGQSLHIKAYTKWMQNFDNAFIYHRDIKVFQSWTNKKLIAKPTTTLHLFPEAGTLIAGIASKVAFKANNQKGLPVTIVSGVVKNTQGEELAKFKSVHDGMGSFLIVPNNSTDSLVAFWQDEFGNNGSTPLPKITSTGATFQVSLKTNKMSIQITRSDSVAESFKELHVLAHLHQQPFAEAKINLSEKTSALIQIPIIDLPTGVVEVTLFNKDWLPIAERIVFVNNHQYQFNPTITTVNKGLGKRQKNVYEIEVIDSIQSNMSLSVTDADLSVDSSYNIFSELLLTGDIKGYVHNPSYYFNNQADSVTNHLDLVMLTNGWRRIKWEELLKGKMPTIINERDSDYLQILGNLVGSTKKERIQTGQQVLLILQPPNGKNQSLILPVRSDRTFRQSGVFFMDTIKVFYKFIGGDNNIGNTSELVLNDGLVKPNTDNLKDNELLPYLWLTDTALIAREKYFAEQRLKMDKMSQAINLREVIVQSKTKRNVDIMDEKYASGLFSGGDSYQFDVMNDPRGQSAINVFSYLQGQVAGLQILPQPDGETSLKWRGNNTELFLDETRTDADFLYSLSMGDVAYIKIFRPPFFGATGGGAGGAISIYTRKGADVQSRPGVGLPYKLLAGYTSYKEFYSPDYAIPTSAPTDIRNTIYWNPFILTDKGTRRVKVEFFNNDVSKRLRFVLEGINLEGKMTRIEKIIE